MTWIQVLKLLFLTLSLCPLVFSPKASALRDLGVGLILVGPTGLSVNKMLSSRKSIDLAVSGAGLSGSDLYIHSTYLWNKPRLLDLDEFQLDVHYGAGGIVETGVERVGSQSDGFSLGARAPIGVSYLFKKVQIQVFGEFSASLRFIPRFQFGLDLGFGARYYF